MTQMERRIYLIQSLLKEEIQYQNIAIPTDETRQRDLLRSLMNLRPVHPIDKGFLNIQDEYFQAETAARGITDIADLNPVEPGIISGREI